MTTLAPRADATTLADRRIELSVPVFDDTYLEPGYHVVLAPLSGDTSAYGAFGKIEDIDGDAFAISSDVLPDGFGIFTADEFRMTIPGITPLV